LQDPHPFTTRLTNHRSGDDPEELHGQPPPLTTTRRLAPSCLSRPKSPPEAPAPRNAQAIHRNFNVAATHWSASGLCPGRADAIRCSASDLCPRRPGRSRSRIRCTGHRCSRSTASSPSVLKRHPARGSPPRLALYCMILSDGVCVCYSN
jgi:hypothetical protein